MCWQHRFPMIKFERLYLEETESTNDIAKEKGKKGKDFLAVMARMQTKGRGRMGRSFSSRKDNGLYMSLLFPMPENTCVPVIAALAVREVIASYSRQKTVIKWPNDILIHTREGYRKICGILCEAFVRDGKSFAICGIGVNLKDDFPEELKEIATCLSAHTDKAISAEQLGEEICLAFSSYLEKEIRMDEYQKHLVNLNRRVSAVQAGQQIEGVCVGLNEKGELLVQAEEKEILVIHAGDVAVYDI